MAQLSAFVIEVVSFWWEELGGIAATIVVGGGHFFEEIELGLRLVALRSDDALLLLFCIGVEKSIQFLIFPHILCLWAGLNFGAFCVVISLELGNAVFQTIQNVFFVGAIWFFVLGEEVGGSGFVFVEFVGVHPKGTVFVAFALRFGLLLFGVDEGRVFADWRFAALLLLVLRKIVDVVAIVVIDYRDVEVVYQTVGCLHVILRRSLTA